MTPGHVTLTAVPNLPEFFPGDDVATVIGNALDAAGLDLRDGDVLVIAQKIISKAEGRQRRLADVRPTVEGELWAERTGKDPRLVTLILQESSAVSRWRPGLLIVRHRLGFTSANAGIDRSNVPQDGDTVLLLPLDPDGSAAQLRHALQSRANGRLAIIISDSHGRPHRMGTVGIAIGVAGLPALWDRRGEADRDNYLLQHTDVGLADEIAAAAGLLLGQAAESTPVILVRGLNLPPGSTPATALVRGEEKDLYR